MNWEPTQRWFIQLRNFEVCPSSDRIFRDFLVWRAPVGLHRICQCFTGLVAFFQIFLFDLGCTSKGIFTAKDWAGRPESEAFRRKLPNSSTLSPHNANL